MNNVILGKTIKAMYKLSGKTLTQLSDESGLTVDTINNLFYARIQKPGLVGVNALVKAMGFSIQQLMGFLDENADLSEDDDVTERFTVYSAAAADTTGSVPSAKETVKHTKGDPVLEMGLLSAEHEKEIERLRTTQERYAEQLREYNRQMEQQFHTSLHSLETVHAQEIERLDRDNGQLRKSNKMLGIAVSIESGLILLLLLLDILNRSIGWIR